MPDMNWSDGHKIAVIGGDLRLIYLAIGLSKQGYPVTVYGNHPTFYQLSKEDSNYYFEHIVTSESFSSTVKNNNILLLPTPLSKDNEHITCQKQCDPISVSSFLAMLTHKPMIIGGAISSKITQFLAEHYIPYCDLMKLEPVAIGNAIATAEGTILEAIKHSPGNLHQSNSLILGYGRCAKILAQKLKGMDANVTVAARRQEAIAYSNAYGFKTAMLPDVLTDLSSYDYIFNTVPVQLLNKKALMTTKFDVTIIDIASAPGGTDFTAAKELDRNAVLCLALPGLYAPKASAQIMLDPILRLFS